MYIVTKLVTPNSASVNNFIYCLDFSTENTAYMAGLGKVRRKRWHVLTEIGMLYAFQASELVCENLAVYHKHMKEIRDYLEKQLSVRIQCDSYA